MMTGVVRAREAHIRLKVRGPRGREHETEAVIDTGYTGWLTLPPALVIALGLRWQCFGRGILADGTENLFDVYEATVVWDQRARRVPVDEVDTTPLVGMALLSGYELKVQVRTGGTVTIQALPKRKRA
jgi:clan AA aspartic protease